MRVVNVVRVIEKNDSKRSSRQTVFQSVNLQTLGRYQNSGNNFARVEGTYMSNVTALSIESQTIDIKSFTDDELIEGVQDFIDKEVARLNQQADEIQVRAMDLEDIKMSDLRLRRRLKTENEPITLDKIKSLWIKVTEPDRAAVERERAIHHKSWSKSASLRYFTVTNAQNNTVHVLADDASVARYIVHQIGRIKERTNGHVRVYDTVSIEKLAYGMAIEQALAAGWPGVIEIMQTKVIHPSHKMVFG